MGRYNVSRKGVVNSWWRRMICLWWVMAHQPINARTPFTVKKNGCFTIKGSTSVQGNLTVNNQGLS
ncbi:MAG: hypothetical protein R3F23_09500 [Verrucomicrobiia bacterium]